MVQAKAGQVEQALVTAKQMEERGMRPDTFTLNILLSACARAVPRNPFRAVAVRDMMTKQYGTSTSPIDRWPLLKRFPWVCPASTMMKGLQCLPLPVMKDEATVPVCQGLFSALDV